MLKDYGAICLPDLMMVPDAESARPLPLLLLLFELLLLLLLLFGVDELFDCSIFPAAEPDDEELIDDEVVLLLLLRWYDDPLPGPRLLVELDVGEELSTPDF